ncbi:MAG: WD40 repeat domain-containing protein [Treponema sp.]|jgi:hypothetical protein|nr:WD40 repeat domain-containing protein [Treponema sp.]
MNKNILKSLLFIIILLNVKPLFSLNAAGSHRGEISALVHNGDTILSAGCDGFLVTWSLSQKTAVDRFQLTTYRIQSMIKHPGKHEICIIEAVNLDNHRISVWNYEQKEKLFSVYSNKPVSYVNYSAAGSYLIVSGFNGFPLTLLNSTTGEIFLNAEIPAGNTSLAVTGRAERNIMIYQNEHDNYFGHSSNAGNILYFDITSNSVTASFQSPGFLLNTVLFGNGILIAGVSHDGLFVMDTTSGSVIYNNRNIGPNALLCLSDDGFFCLDMSASSAVLYNFSVDRNGNIITHQRLPLSLNEMGTITSITYNRSLVFGTSQGCIFLIEQQGANSRNIQNRITPFTFSNFPRRITEIAAGEKTIALLTEDGYFSYLPLQHNMIGGNLNLNFKEYTNYNRITSFSLQGNDYYILWQTQNARIPAQLIDLTNNEPKDLSFLTRQSPLRTISVFNNRLLTLDTGGNISVYNLESIQLALPSTRAEHTISSVGAIDAVFINDNTLLISRSVINNNSPFFTLDVRTGETVPVFFPVQSGLIVYRGNTSHFGVALEFNNYFNIVFLNLSFTGQQSRLYEYPGEANYLSIAEAANRLAIICDSEGAMILPGIIKFERTSGLPTRLLTSGNLFICLDSEGNITWHDLNGKLLNHFRLQ